MPELIRDGAVVENDWVRIDDIVSDPTDLPTGRLLLPLALWNSLGNELVLQGREVGLWLASDQLPEEIEGDLNRIPVIAVDFPAFTDGRGFSIGRLLRERHGFTNELRAIGAPIRDQLTYLKRCGFNAFELAEHYDPEQALASMNDFNQSYQAAVDEKLPRFRRPAVSN